MSDHLIPIFLQPDGTYLTADGIPYNPASPYLGLNYTLSAPGGVTYNINGSTGQLTNITTANGDTLTVTPSGITSTDAGGNVVAAITITRDYDNRITKITDQSGNVLTYAYDSAGDLVSFTDQSDNTTSYEYNLSTRPHFLTDIINAQGVDVAHAEFDSTGQLEGLVDSSGNLTSLSYNTQLGNGIYSAQSVDALGDVTIAVTDANGNVIGKIQQITPEDDMGDGSAVQYIETVFTFDGDNNQTGQSQPFEVTGSANEFAAFANWPTVPSYVKWLSQSTYDSNGDVTSTTDAEGNTTFYAYNQFGEVTTTTEPNGKTTTNEYDSSGNLIQSTDEEGNVTTYSYDGNGNLISTTTPSGGGTTTNTYNSLDQLTSTTDPNGVTNYYTYDAAGNQTSDSFTWVNPDDSSDTVTLTTSTTYNAAGQVTGTTDAQGNTTSQTYNSAGQVVTSTDEYGNVTTNTYDQRGLLIQTTTQTKWGPDDSDSGLLVTRTVYDADGRATLTTDQYLEDSSTTPMLSGDPGSLPTFATVTVYNTLGQVIQTYRLSGVVIDLTGAAGDQETSIDGTYPGTVVANSTTTTTYNAQGNVVETVDGFGNETINIYDETGNLVETAKQSQNADNSPAWVITQTVYDAYGRAVFTTNPFVATLNTETGAFDPSSTPITGTQTIYDAFGNVVQTNTLDDMVTTLTVNDDGTGQVTVDSDTIVSITQTVFNTLGQTVETIGPYAPGSTDAQTAANAAAAPTTNYEYDSQGRQIAEIYSAAYDAAVGAVMRLRVETQYNGFDGQQSEVISNILQLPDGATAPSGMTSEFHSVNGDMIDTNYQQITSYVYDPYGNLIETIYPDNSTTFTSYNSQNQKVTSTDQLGRVTTYSYDSMGRLASTSLPAVPDPANDNAMTNPVYQYQYDAFGNQVAVIDPLGSTTTYTFDSQGNQLTETLPLGQTGQADAGTQTSYNYYDGLGRLTLAISLDDVVTQYVYNDTAGGDGQLEAENYFHNMAAYDDYLADDGTVPGETTTYTYDALGQMVEIEDTFSNGDPSRITMNSYDEWGNLIEVQSPEGTVGYIYDPVTGEHIGTWTGSQTSPTTGETYSYDALERLTEVSVSTLNGILLSAPQNTLYTYNLDGSLATETLPNGVVSYYTYNAVDDLTNLTEDNASGTLLAEYIYTLALDGTRTAAVEDVQQSDGTYAVTDITWTYDADNRLTGEYETSTEPSLTGQDYSDVYTYDLAANRLSDIHVGPGGGADSTTTYTYNANDELLTQAVTTGSGDSATTVTTTFTYDAAGNQIESDDGTNVTTYTYNLLNKMASVTINGVTTTYAYDDAGNRVEETTNFGTSNAVTSYYLTDINNPTGYAQPIEQWTSTASSQGIRSHTLTYIIGRRITGQVDSSGAVTFFLTDGHGSTRLLVNASGLITYWMNYNDYGTALNFNAATAPTMFQFGGDSVYDPPSGLYLQGNGIRARSVETFLQMDDVHRYGNPQQPVTFNPYLYASANPISFTDPSGHFSLIELLITVSIDTGLLALYGGAIGGVATVASNFAMNRPLTQGLGTGIGFGAVALPLSLACPAAGVALAVAGLAGASYVTYTTWANPNSTRTQKGVAVLLFVASGVGVWGSVNNLQANGWFNPRALSPALNATPVAPLTTGSTLAQLLPNGISDDAYIHVTPSDPSAFSAGANPKTYFFRFGDIKNLTLTQIRGLIGPGAAGARPGANTIVIVDPAASGMPADAFQPYGALQGGYYQEYVTTTTVQPTAVAKINGG